MNEAQLKLDLIRDEGTSLLAYQDSVGLWTIGVGHLLGIYRRMDEITQRECESLLNGDIEAAQEVATQLVPVFHTLDDVRQRALCNMAFNLGMRLQQFVKFLEAVNQYDWPTAAKEMMSSQWATQVPERAQRLHDMILTGTEP